MIPPPPRSTLFPYTTLFRSGVRSVIDVQLTTVLQVTCARDTRTCEDRKSTRLNSSHEWISYAVFCLKKKKKNNTAGTYNAMRQANALSQQSPKTPAFAVRTV